MNKDIKEILVRSKEQQALDDLIALANAKENEEVYIEYGLNTKAKILLDYITNLQEKINNSIKYINEKVDYPIEYYNCLREIRDILKGK